jgi:SAM-dependent methyltransferase
MPEPDYRSWIASQDWYQTIELKNGVMTRGKFPTHARLATFSTVDFTGARVLDVGCNSGQCSLYAKSRGAREVVGVDVDEHRLLQARTLAANEGLSIQFLKRGIDELGDLGTFDLVFCLAVLTEVSDLFGAIESLKAVIGGRAFVELALAKPLVYLSRPTPWGRGGPGLSRRDAVAEIRRTKRGQFVISPTWALLEAAFGAGYRLRTLGPGVRYELVEVVRNREGRAP